MLARLWRYLTGTREPSDEDDTRFVPSPLDRSVRDAHGGADGEIERELEAIDERAAELEAERDR